MRRQKAEAKRQQDREGSKVKRLIATATAALALIAAPAASAAFGDHFGFSSINDGAGPLQEVPALPGAGHAFWAGTCDRSAAPGLGQPILPNSGPGAGIGNYSATVYSPNGSFSGYVTVAAPAVPPHCLEWGAASAPSFTVPPAPSASLPWSQPPAWRLPAENQAGGHPDGTTGFSFNRTGAGFGPDGTLDNIVAELPPGFVGDPNAVPKCSAELFSSRPLLCPPETQLGVLHLEIVAAPFSGNAPGGDERIYPLYNIEPRRGNVAELGFGYASGESAVSVRIVAKARTNSDHGVTAFVGQIPGALQVRAQQITIWGVPWAASNDRWRGPASLQPGFGGCNSQAGTFTNLYLPPSGLTSPGCAQHYQPSWGPIMPFVSNVTQCTGKDLSTRVAIDEFQQPGAFASDGRPVDPVSGKFGAANGDPDYSDPDWRVYESPAPPMSGCEQVEFHPDITLDPKGQGGAATQATDSPSGLDVELSIPQNELPFNPPPGGAPQVDIDQYIADASAYWKSDQGLATSHLQDTVVTLPEGMTLNPAAADGQGACTTRQIGLTDTNNPKPPAIRFDNGAIECPDSSKVGEVVVETPVLDEADWPMGSVYLAAQGDNPFHSDFAIYIGVESPDRGLIVKLAGKVTPDPDTGRLTTTFAENPQLPFDKFRLRFKAGPRAPLATPVTCGTHTNVTQLAPYSDPSSPAVVNHSFDLSASPAGGCPATKAERPFGLGFSAGSASVVAGAHSPFTLRLTRGDGNQELDRIEVTTPEGLAAKLAGVPYCSEAGIAQAIARTASGDGATEKASPSCPASSQVGTTTIGAGAGASPFYVSGKVYLAGPYKGAPVSLAFIVPAVAGPFDLGVQVVRTGLRVNPKTAQVTAVSDTIPKILRGVPLRIRDIRVDIDRPGFTLNPTDCAEQRVTGTVFGASGAVTTVSNRFQVAECTRLGFKPNLSIRLFGDTHRGDYQRLKAVVTARPGDANIARAAVTLPHSEFLAQEHIRTVCTRVQFAADQCPAAAIYGKATAISPLLDQPLTGPVYLRSSDNLLPDLVAALKGPDNQPIEIELSGRTDSKNEGIRNTFDVVPDAPVSKFTLEMQGGKKSLIVNSTNICQGIHKANVRMDGQNGRKHNFETKVVNPACGKVKKKGKKAEAHKRPVAMRTLASVAGGLF
jgi:hypothetical protein